jgi:hypothetical protein
MADITYTRSVSFNDYIDGETIVSAGGSDGFNVRFHALEHEFDAISTIVSELDAAVKAVGQPPPPQQAKLVLTPNLVATAANAWSHQQGIAQKPPGQTGAQGMMSISLPNNVRVVSLRVIGANSGAGALRIILHRQALVAGTTAFDQIVRVDGTGTPFDLNNPADPTFAVVDNNGFKYFLMALLDNAQAADNVTLSAFQITYLPLS